MSQATTTLSWDDWVKALAQVIEAATPLSPREAVVYAASFREFYDEGCSPTDTWAIELFYIGD